MTQSFSVSRQLARLGLDGARIAAQAGAALAEDLGGGDVTADLLDPRAEARAQVICREAAVLCGRPWFDAVFAALDAGVAIHWQAEEGARLNPAQTVCELRGPAAALLTGERTALNFLQTLSGTATLTRRYADALAGTTTRVLDTRKTIPGLRLAQKYAVACGGGHNHRLGLWDMVLIKENHILSAGSIAAAVAAAGRRHPDLPREVEVESLDELREALEAGAERVLLDNMAPATLAEAVALTAGRALLEASGNVTIENIREIAQTGVDFVSVGALTKHVQAIDFSMRVLAAPA